MTSDVVWGMAQEERMKGLVQGLGWKESRVAKASQTQPGLELPFELFVSCGVTCLPMSEILDILLGLAMSYLDYLF